LDVVYCIWVSGLPNRTDHDREVRGSVDMDFMRDVDYVYDDPSWLMQVEHGPGFRLHTQRKEGVLGGTLSKGVDELDADGEIVVSSTVARDEGAQ
jgi:hypothetical protein